MKLSRYISIPLGLSLLCACSDPSFLNTPEDGTPLCPIVLSAAYPTATRASDDGFEDGDRMGIYVMDYSDGVKQEIDDPGVHAANTRFDFKGEDNKWTSTYPLYWTSKDIPADIIGYYPYSATVAAPKAYSFSIERRQDRTGGENEPGGYESSDFLWTKAEKVMPSTSAVNLTFGHVMAGVRVTLKEGNGYEPGEWGRLKKTVLIPNIKPSTTINLEDGSTGDAYGDEISVSTYNYGGDWRAIVVPQKIDAGKSIVDISVDGVGYHLKKEESTHYAGGKLNTFTIEVNKRSDGGGYDFAVIDEAILPWIDDVDFRDGIIRNYLVVNVERRGTLKGVLENMGISASGVTNLKISGEIVNDDFDFLREECSSLNALNLSDATVWKRVIGWNPETYQEDKIDYPDEIPYGAFREKSTLKHIVLPKNLRKIGGGAFNATGLMGHLIIPEGVEEICDDDYPNGGCFGWCRSLTGRLELPSSLKYIGRNAFYYCSFSGELRIPKNLKKIGPDAFGFNKFSGDLIIPEGVEKISSYAFAHNEFSGRLELPQSLSCIESGVFFESGFRGVLALTESVRSIDSYAFKGCGFSGELKLPSSLLEVGVEAFAETRISGVVFPENIYCIGDGAFEDCKYLRGSIKWPKKVQRVNDRMFAGCNQLSEFIIHEDVVVVGRGILYDCNSLKRLVCNSVQPPLAIKSNPKAQSKLEYGSFDGMSKNNFTLQVPEESVALYRQADGWKDFTRVSPTSDFVCRPVAACALNTEHTETLVIDSNKEWELLEKPDWCSLSNSEGKNKQEILLTIHELPRGTGNREGKVVFRQKGTDFTTECAVSQYDYVYPENHCLTLQKATEGEGIDILFVGDGWDAEAISNGGYIDLVKEQMEAFFGVEPFTTYRNRFNVYACIALSQDCGVNTTATWVETRFNTTYYHESRTLAIEHIDDVFDYAINYSPLTFRRMHESLVIVTLNSDEYGSATIITDNGSAVSICSPSIGTYPMDTRGIVQHEACGHGFGKLADESIQQNRYLNDYEKNDVYRYQNRGWFQNISLEGKISFVPWSNLIFDSRYSDKVDVFEGGYGVTRGVYRAEENTCMNNGIPYFSAISRQDIMQRIFNYSGFTFSMDEFYRTDSDKWGETSTSRAAVADEGSGHWASAFHHPVRIVKSKKY